MSGAEGMRGVRSDEVEPIRVRRAPMRRCCRRQLTTMPRSSPVVGTRPRTLRPQASRRGGAPAMARGAESPWPRSLARCGGRAGGVSKAARSEPTAPLSRARPGAFPGGIGPARALASAASGSIRAVDQAPGDCGRWAWRAGAARPAPRRRAGRREAPNAAAMICVPARRELGCPSRPRREARTLSVHRAHVTSRGAAAPSVCSEDVELICRQDRESSRRRSLRARSDRLRPCRRARGAVASGLSTLSRESTTIAGIPAVAHRAGLAVVGLRDAEARLVGRATPRRYRVRTSTAAWRRSRRQLS